MNKTTNKDRKSMQIHWYEEKKKTFSKILSLYTLNYRSVVLEMITSKFSFSLEIMSRNTFPNSQPDSAS